VLALQNSKDLLKGELGSCSKTCSTSTVDGNEAIGVEAERVLDITEEGDQQPTTNTVIKIEPNVSCVHVIFFTHISYRLYPELLTSILFCPCEINFLLSRLVFQKFLRK
jgi:hypothetical protein